MLGLGAVAMHWLCYLPGADGEGALGGGVHAYVVGATPLLVAIAASMVLLSLAISYRAPSLGDQDRSFEAQAVRYASILLAAFAAQELAEIMVSDVGPQAADAVLGAGGWVVAPIALFVGALAALGSRTLERVCARLATRLRPGRLDAGASLRVGPAHLVSVSHAHLGLAFGFARRPPPWPLCA